MEDKIAELIFDKVQNEIIKFEDTHKRRPNYVVLSEFMVGLLEDYNKRLVAKFYLIPINKVQTLNGLIIIKSLKVKDVKDVEVY